MLSPSLSPKPITVWILFAAIGSVCLLWPTVEASSSSGSEVVTESSTPSTTISNDSEKNNATKPKPVSINLDNISPETLSRIPNKTRMIYYEYDFNATTVLYELKSGKDKGVQTVIKGKYKFDILHHDIKGNIMARYRFVKCIAGPCHYRIPDIYVDFIQGGNNLEGLYMKLEDGEKPHWNPLLAILHSMNTPAVPGAGDEQNVVTPYGRCHYKFSRPHDKRFRRRMDHCSLDGIYNHTLIPGVTIQNYEQDIMYYQNTKLDADIVFIDVEEKMTLSSAFDDQWNLQMDVESHMEMMNRTMKYLLRVCPYEVMADYCAANIFNATKIGTNWVEIMKNLEVGKIPQVLQLQELLNKYKALSTETSSTPGLMPKLFVDIVNAIQLYSEEVLDEVIATNIADDTDDHSEATLSANSAMLIDALAAAGTVQAYNVAVHRLQKPEMLKRYLQSLVWTTNLNKAIIKKLQQWHTDCHNSDKNREICIQIGFTLASLLRRYCQSSPSQSNACNKAKDQIVNKFLDKLMDCNVTECHEHSLSMLLNLPVETVLPYATKFICANENHTKSAQRIALKLMSQLPTKKISGKVLKKVMQIFRNSCPLPQSTTDQTLASEVLLNAVPEHTAVGTFLLRMESTNPNDHERWAYFYDNLAVRRSNDEMVDEYWSQLRRFRVFRPNYAHRSLSALSNIFQLTIADNKNYKIPVLSTTEFNSGVFKRSELNAYATVNRQRHQLFGLDINTEGLGSVAASSDDESSPKSEDSNELKADVQFALFGSREPPITLFNGYSQLMSSVWNADGDQFNVLDKNIVVRNYRMEIPLMSGLTAVIVHKAAINVHIDGSISVSLWNKNAQASLNANTTMVLEAFVELLSNTAQYGKANLQTTVSGSITTDLNADFYSEPHSFCMIVGQGPLQITHIYSCLEAQSSKTKTLKRTRHMDGNCYALNRSAMKMCK